MTASEVLEQAAANLDNAESVVALTRNAPADVRQVAETAKVRAQALFQILLKRVMKGTK